MSDIEQVLVSARRPSVAVFVWREAANQKKFVEQLDEILRPVRAVVRFHVLQKTADLGHVAHL